MEYEINFNRRKLSSVFTYIDHPVFGIVSVGSTNIQPFPISHRLDDSYVVSTIEMLKRKKTLGHLS